MCGFCEDDPYDEPDYDDEDEEWPDDMAYHETHSLDIAKAIEPTDGYKLRLEVMTLLLAADEAKIQEVHDLLTAVEEDRITEVSHTLWQGQEDGNGFHVYHVTHDLNNERVLVSLDTNELYTYSVVDANVVAIVCPESLWGVDVEVRVKSES